MTDTSRGTIYIVDDDASVRKSLCRLVTSAGYAANPFSCARDFLESPAPDGPACLVLDIRMPSMTGLELQETLNSLEDRSLPIIFITGHGNVPMSVRAMKAGAIDFLTKPFNDVDLLGAISTAVERDKKARKMRRKTADIEALIDTLTPREREVMRLVVTGIPNKQVADKLGIKEKTIKVHRGSVMRKMKVKSFADLVRMGQGLLQNSQD